MLSALSRPSREAPTWRISNLAAVTKCRERKNAVSPKPTEQRSAHLAYFELGRHDPELGEGEELVRQQLEGGAVHLAAALRVLRLELLKESVPA